MTIPEIITKAGLQPNSPATLRQLLVDTATEIDPDLTANLPGSLIEDIASTDTGALIVMDQAKVDTINSLSPETSNELITRQLGAVYGVELGEGSNGSVFEVFTGTVGFSVPVGFTVTNGTVQFVVQDGGIVADTGDGPNAGQTPPLFCLASTSGTFAIPANTVNALITSLPPDIVLSCNNPQAGTQAEGVQTEPEYRAQVIQAGLASAQGMTRFLKTLLAEVPGVQQRLISARQVPGGWAVIVGGGDPYAVAGAIFDAVFYLPGLKGSVIGADAITNSNPAQITTDLNHGLVSGQSNVRINGAQGMTEINGGPYTVHVVSEKVFTIPGLNATLFGVYTGGAVITPNSRNITVSINDYPDVYNITFVNPPQQSVDIALTWNTTAVNFVSDASIAQVGSLAISNYVNSIPVGVAINLFEMQTVFQEAIADIIPAPLLSRMVFSVSINGVATPVDAGTGLFEGDPESYFLMTATQVVISRG